jgi:hypothetical protein
LDYNLGNVNYNWAQIRCNFDPPLDLSAYDHLRFDWRGDPLALNSLEIGVVITGTGQEYIFGRGYHHPTHHGWWGQMVVPFPFLAPWTPGTTFDPSQVSAIFISVVKDQQDDVGGVGRMAIDNLSAYNVVSRTTPPIFEHASPNPAASLAAVNWLISQQQTQTHLLKSWEEESICTAHIYDQALALLVFTHAGRWAKADQLVEALAAAQNLDGSWYKSYGCASPAPPPPLCVHCDKWEGDIAWAIYALSRYRATGGAHTIADTAIVSGTNWLAQWVQPDGCLVVTTTQTMTRETTEGTLDTWWAFYSAGPNYLTQTAQVQSCLLTEYWDDALGRFKSGRGQYDYQPFLDNQTWGAAFLNAIDQPQAARRALSYAWETLRVPAQGGQLFGFDGQGGPWSVWNEGTGQYVAMCGTDADDMLIEILAQQRPNGAMPGSPDDFSGGGVWTTRWHGVAPTAWFYFALTRRLSWPGHDLFAPGNGLH